MRTTLTIAGLLGSALLVPTQVANAVGETCRGEAATIVGSPGDPALLGSDGITGTEGRDVVVTNGATKVSTLGGDDVICVTAGGASSVKRVVIDAGAGDDIVEGTTAPDWVVQADLGAGPIASRVATRATSSVAPIPTPPCRLTTQLTPRRTSSSVAMAQMWSTAASSGSPTPM